MTPRATQQGSPFPMSWEQSSLQSSSLSIFLDHFWNQLHHLVAKMGLEVPETNWKYARERHRDERPKVGRKILQTKMWRWHWKTGRWGGLAGRSLRLRDGPNRASISAAGDLVHVAPSGVQRWEEMAGPGTPVLSHWLLAVLRRAWPWLKHCNSLKVLGLEAALRDAPQLPQPWLHKISKSYVWYVSIHMHKHLEICHQACNRSFLSGMELRGEESKETLSYFIPYISVLISFYNLFI